MKTNHPTTGEKEEKKIVQLSHSRVEIDPLDPDYSLSEYPASHITRLILKANELGLEGKTVKVIEVKERIG